MQIVYSDNELQHYMRFAVEASPERPVLVDKFLEDATEVDVDCIADVGRFANPEDGTTVIGGLLEHSYPQAGARQRQGCRQPRNAGASDDDVTRRRQGSGLRIFILSGDGEWQRALGRPRRTRVRLSKRIGRTPY